MKAMFALIALAALLSFAACGCGTAKDSSATDGASSSGGKRPKGAGQDASGENSAASSGKKKKFQPIQLDAGGDNSATASGGSKVAAVIPDEKKVVAVIAALQPFQVVLGNWRWTTNRKFGKSAMSGEDIKWIWDFKTSKMQPALTFHSDKNPYFHTGALTYLADVDKFRFTGESSEGEKRVFEGTWAEGGEPTETFEGKKSQRSYKLQLTQVSPETGEQWRVTLNQQDNDRYLFELKKKPPQGTQFGPLDTVASQRLGTNFAALDSDNPGVKCIISGGLGTMTASYKGKDYPMCCTGCIAAFNDDPERWLAKLAKSEAEKKKMAE